MGRKKLLRVLDLEKGNSRLAAVKSIDALDLGDEITVVKYETELTSLAAKISSYNTALSAADNLHNECMAQIEVVKDWNERILTGVASRYGKNSSEYEMAGGTRKSERRTATTPNPES